MLGHSVRQRGGHDGLAHDGILGHGALLDAARADVVQQQHANLVAGEQLIAAVLALDGDAHTVGIRVGGQHQVGAGGFRQFQTKAQRLENFGVGIRAGGEVAVRVLLLGNDGHIVNADVRQNVGDGHQTGAVQRAVHQLETGGLADAGTDGAGLDGLVQSVDAVIAHILYEAGGNTLLKGHDLGAGEDVGLLNLGVDDVSGLIGHLAAIGAVRLVAVVLGGVVGRGDHDARVAVVVAGGKAQRRDRHERLVDAHMYTVGGQHLGGGLGEHIALDAAVIADGNGLGAALGLDPVGEALRGLTHHVHVHAVGARADDAAQTCGAEFERHGETILNGGIIALDAFQLGFEIRVGQIGGQPTFVHFLIHSSHHHFQIGNGLQWPFFSINIPIYYFFVNRILAKYANIMGKILVLPTRNRYTGGNTREKRDCLCLQGSAAWGWRGFPAIP